MKHQSYLSLFGAWIVTGGMSLFVAGSVTAGDCGCEPACGLEAACGAEATCGAEAECGCEPVFEPGCGFEDADCGCEPTCGSEPACGFEPTCGLEPACECEMGSCDGGCDAGCKPKRFNPIYQSLDAVAGGIEKLFGLDKRRKSCGGQCGCESSPIDCGCSSGHVMKEPLMVPTPIPSAPIHQSHTHHRHLEAPMPPSTVAPSIRSQPRMSSPRLVPSPSTGSAAPLSDPNAIQSSQPEIQSPVPDSVPNVFSDPFGDDEVHVRRFQPVKPSAYQTESAGLSSSERSSKRLRASSSSRQRPLSDNYRSSSRRSASLR